MPRGTPPVGRPGHAVGVGDEEAANTSREGGAHGERVAVGGQGDAPVPAQARELGEQGDAGAVGERHLDDQEVERGDGTGTGPGLSDAGCFNDLERPERVEARTTTSRSRPSVMTARAVNRGVRTAYGVPRLSTSALTSASPVLAPGAQPLQRGMTGCLLDHRMRPRTPVAPTAVPRGDAQRLRRVRGSATTPGAMGGRPAVEASSSPQASRCGREVGVERGPGGADLDLGACWSVGQRAEGLRRDAGDGAAGGGVRRSATLQRLDQPGPADRGQHRVAGDVGLDGRPGERHDAELAVPGLVTVGVVEHDEPTRGQVLRLVVGVIVDHVGRQRHGPGRQALRRRGLLRARSRGAAALRAGQQPRAGRPRGPQPGPAHSRDDHLLRVGREPRGRGRISFRHADPALGSTRQPGPAGALGSRE